MADEVRGQVAGVARGAVDQGGATIVDDGTIDPSSVAVKTFTGPALSDPAEFTRARFRTADVSAGNGHGTARALSAIFGNAGRPASAVVRLSCRGVTPAVRVGAGTGEVVDEVATGESPAIAAGGEPEEAAIGEGRDGEWEQTP